MSTRGPPIPRTKATEMLKETLKHYLSKQEVLLDTPVPPLELYGSERSISWILTTPEKKLLTAFLDTNSGIGTCHMERRGKPPFKSEGFRMEYTIDVGKKLNGTLLGRCARVLLRNFDLDNLIKEARIPAPLIPYLQEISTAAKTFGWSRPASTYDHFELTVTNEDFTLSLGSRLMYHFPSDFGIPRVKNTKGANVAGSDFATCVLVASDGSGYVSTGPNVQLAVEEPPLLLRRMTDSSSFFQESMMRCVNMLYDYTESRVGDVQLATNLQAIAYPSADWVELTEEELRTLQADLKQRRKQMQDTIANHSQTMHSILCELTKEAMVALQGLERQLGTDLISTTRVGLVNALQL